VAGAATRSASSSRKNIGVCGLDPQAPFCFQLSTLGRVPSLLRARFNGLHPSKDHWQVAEKLIRESRPFLECGDLSPLSYRLLARSLACAVSWYIGVKAATSRRTPNLTRELSGHVARADPPQTIAEFLVALQQSHITRFIRACFSSDNLPDSLLFLFRPAR
jgi:hypothetical protein